MPATTFTARQTAADVKAALSKRGIARDVDAKRVRAYVRDNVASFDDDGYTAHLYDAKTHTAIVTAMVARYAGTGKAPKAQRAAAASSGRNPSAKGKAAVKADPQTMPQREAVARAKDAAS